jgi:hypothetical protein
LGHIGNCGLKMYFCEIIALKKCCMRVRIFFSTLLVLMFSTGLLFAQDPIGQPCAGNDADLTGCPLDTWVVLLAFIAIVFAARHIYRKQKQSTPNLQG